MSARATATRCGITRVEQRGKDLRFLFPTLRLSAWSEAFAKFPGLRMAGAPEPFVSYRLRPGEEPAATVLKILSAYAAGISDTQ